MFRGYNLVVTLEEKGNSVREFTLLMVFIPLEVILMVSGLLLLLLLLVLLLHQTVPSLV